MATEAELQRYAAASTKNPPNIPDRAAQADQYWGPRLQLPDPPDLASFRGLYTTVYRRGSSRTHATVLGLNDVIRRAGVEVDRGRSGHPPTGLARLRGGRARA